MSKLFINTENIMSLQDNHKFIIKWWLSSHDRINWVLITNTSNTFLCSKCVYKTQLLDEAVKRRCRKNSELIYIDSNEKPTAWAISSEKYQNFRNSLGNISNSKFLSGRLKLSIHTWDWFCMSYFHRGNFWGGFSRGTEAGCTKIRLYVLKFLLKDLCYTIFHSHFIYACQIWGQTFKTSNKTQTLQDNAVWIINSKADNYDVGELYKNDKILRISYYIKLLKCLFVRDN